MFWVWAVLGLLRVFVKWLQVGLWGSLRTAEKTVPRGAGVSKPTQPEPMGIWCPYAGVET